MERGSGKFKRVTWDEAIDHIGQKLTEIKKKYGAESAIMDCGDVTDRDHYYRLFFAYGTPNCTGTAQYATLQEGMGQSLWSAARGGSLIL